MMHAIFQFWFLRLLRLFVASQIMCPGLRAVIQQLSQRMGGFQSPRSCLEMTWNSDRMRSVCRGSMSGSSMDWMVVRSSRLFFTTLNMLEARLTVS